MILFMLAARAHRPHAARGSPRTRVTTSTLSEVDPSGNYQQFLLTYRWSTADPRISAPPPTAAGDLLIIADGHEIKSKPLDQLPLSLALRAELLAANHRVVSAHAFLVDVEMLRFIAASRAISVRLPQEPLDMPFGLWEDGRSALSEFLKHAEIH